jgi:hypothetical protein
MQGCVSDRLIDTAVLGGPKVFVVATLASARPAAPFAFRNYELPEEAAPAAAALAACGGSCKHHVWEVSRCMFAALRLIKLQVAAMLFFLLCCSMVFFH